MLNKNLLNNNLLEELQFLERLEADEAYKNAAVVVFKYKDNYLIEGKGNALTRVQAEEKAKDYSTVIYANIKGTRSQLMNF